MKERLMPIQETRFEYKGFPCVVLFQPMGFRCGYVGLPKGNKYYDRDYDGIDVNCHGGLTYARAYLALQTDNDTWWIGFDCAHCFDYYDIAKLKEYYGEDKAKEIEELFRYLSEYPFRDLEYCIEECKGMVDQIVGDA